MKVKYAVCAALGSFMVVDLAVGANPIYDDKSSGIAANSASTDIASYEEQLRSCIDSANKLELGLTDEEKFDKVLAELKAIKSDNTLEIIQDIEKLRQKLQGKEEYKEAARNLYAAFKWNDKKTLTFLKSDAQTLQRMFVRDLSSMVKMIRVSDFIRSSQQEGRGYAYNWVTGMIRIYRKPVLSDLRGKSGGEIFKSIANELYNSMKSSNSLSSILRKIADLTGRYEDDISDIYSLLVKVSD